MTDIARKDFKAEDYEMLADAGAPSWAEENMLLLVLWRHAGLIELRRQEERLQDQANSKVWRPAAYLDSTVKSCRNDFILLYGRGGVRELQLITCPVPWQSPKDNKRALSHLLGLI